MCIRDRAYTHYIKNTFVYTSQSTNIVNSRLFRTIFACFENVQWTLRSCKVSFWQPVIHKNGELFITYMGNETSSEHYQIRTRTEQNRVVCLLYFENSPQPAPPFNQITNNFNLFMRKYFSGPLWFVHLTYYYELSLWLPTST